MNTNDIGFVRLPRPNAGQMGWFKTRRASEHVKARRVVDNKVKPCPSECLPYFTGGNASEVEVCKLPPERIAQRGGCIDPCQFADSFLAPA